MTEVKMPQRYTTHSDTTTGHIFCDLFSEFQLKQYGDDRAREALEMAARACDECVQYPSITPAHCADHIRALAKEIK